MTTIQFKRGLESNRLSITPLVGELTYITDTKQLWIGDGSTVGGNPLALSSADILTLLNASGSSGLDLDLLDGIQNSSLLQTDQDGTLNGELTLNNSTLSSINNTVNTNVIVDVLVYDTSQDSDGGQWRKRTQHTSWYNETLNTATRGETREFPAIAIIVAEVGTVTIYDATKQDTPMWMVFDGVNSVAMIRIAFSNTIKTVSALNATMVVGGFPGSNVTGIVINFISDDNNYFRASGQNQKFNGTILLRNENLDIINTGIYSVTISDYINDVDMVVLPNAPIDTATGLPRPTILVATDGGISVIKDTGVVIDFTHIEAINNISNNISINDTGLTYTTRLAGFGDIYMLHYPIIAGDIATAPDYAYTSMVAGANSIKALITSIADSMLDFVITDDNMYIAQTNSLTFVKENLDDKPTGMTNFITNAYQTGWMQGDIRGAFLSSTTGTDLVGGTDPDRSYKGNDLTVTGTINRSFVAVNSDLVGYSGFSASNYLEQPYNPDLDFGTGDFYIMGWIKSTADGNEYLLSRGDWSASYTGPLYQCWISAAGIFSFYISDDGQVPAVFDRVDSSSAQHNNDVWNHVVMMKRADVQYIFINGQYDASTPTVNATNSLSNVNATLTIGVANSLGGQTDMGSLALMRIGAGAPSDEQILEIYESEVWLFQDNAKCTLSSTTNSRVTSVAYDTTTNLLYAAGTDNTDTFNGLVRIESAVGGYDVVSVAQGILAKGN